MNDPFDPDLDLSPPERRYMPGTAAASPGAGRWRTIVVRNLNSVAVCAAAFTITYLSLTQTTEQQVNTTERPVAPVARPVAPVREAAAPSAGRAPDQDVWPLPISVRPAFSPSFGLQGRRMVFHTDQGGRSIVMTAALREDGTVQGVANLVASEGRDFHGRLSPDGRLLAFDSDRDGVRGVYVAEADGSQARRVTGNHYAAVPTWSPDGRKLAYVVGEGRKPKVWNLAVLDIESGQSRRVSRHRAGQTWAGSWFPDGLRLCYSHEDALIIANLESGATRRYTSPVKGRMVRTPAVSPDGRLIAFQVYRNGVWLLDVASGSMTRVLADPTAEEFDWAPDARRLAFHSRRDGTWRIWMLALDRPSSASAG